MGPAIPIEGLPEGWTGHYWVCRFWVSFSLQGPIYRTQGYEDLTGRAPSVEDALLMAHAAVGVVQAKAQVKKLK